MSTGGVSIGAEPPPPKLYPKPYPQPQIPWAGLQFSIYSIESAVHISPSFPRDPLRVLISALSRTSTPCPAQHHAGFPACCPPHHAIYLASLAACIMTPIRRAGKLQGVVALLSQMSGGGGAAEEVCSS